MRSKAFFLPSSLPLSENSSEKWLQLGSHVQALRRLFIKRRECRKRCLAFIWHKCLPTVLRSTEHFSVFISKHFIFSYIPDAIKIYINLKILPPLKNRESTSSQNRVQMSLLTRNSCRAQEIPWEEMQKSLKYCWEFLSL